jgi:hypothetical protein
MSWTLQDLVMDVDRRRIKPPDPSEHRGAEQAKRKQMDQLWHAVAANMAGMGYENWQA